MSDATKLTTMRAVRDTPGGVALVDVPTPAVDPATSTLVRVAAVGICGSDLGYLRRGTTSTLGHEISGTTEDGRAVAVEAIFGCGACRACMAGAYNRCPRSGESVIGLTIDGGMADLFAAPTARLVQLPDGLPAATGFLVEPAAVAWHALRRGGVMPGQRVAVVGAGTVGLLTAAAAHELGADRVDVAALTPRQHQAREALGAGDPAKLYDVVVDAVGTPEALGQAVALCAPGGTVVVVGVHGKDLTTPFMPFFFKEVSMVASLGYAVSDGVRDVDAAAGMLARRPEIAEELITHRFGLDEAAQALAVAGDLQSGAIKVVVEP